MVLYGPCTFRNCNRKWSLSDFNFYESTNLYDKGGPARNYLCGYLRERTVFYAHYLEKEKVVFSDCVEKAQAFKVFMIIANIGLETWRFEQRASSKGRACKLGLSFTYNDSRASNDPISCRHKIQIRHNSFFGFFLIKSLPRVRKRGNFLPQKGTEARSVVLEIIHYTYSKSK